MQTDERQAKSDQLIRLLTQQRDLYTRLQGLSTRQRDLVASDQPEQLLTILRERQSLVTSLARINDELSPFRQDWNNLYDQLPDEARAAASSLLDEINQMLQVILKTDQEDGAMLSARKEAVATELRDVGGGRAANAAYARNALHAKTTDSAGLTG